MPQGFVIKSSPRNRSKVIRMKNSAAQFGEADARHS
jgi:hypothetical protein